jgi:hypothetical protein
MGGGMKHRARQACARVLARVLFVCLLPGVLVAAPNLASAEAEFFANHGEFLRRAHGPQPPFGIRFGHYHNVKLDHTDGDTDSEFDVTTLDFGRKWTVPMSPDTATLLGFRFGLRDYHGSGLDETFFEIVPTFGIAWFATANLQISTLFEPGIYSDLEGHTDADDFRFHASVIGTYRVTPTFFAKAGLATNDDFKDLPLLPVAGFVWLPHPDVRLDVLAPRRAVATWNPNAGAFVFHTGVLVRSARYLNHLDHRDTRLRYTDVRAEGGVRVDLASHFSLSLTGGSIIAGWYDIAGDESDQKSTFYLQAGVGFRF